MKKFFLKNVIAILLLVFAFGCNNESEDGDRVTSEESVQKVDSALIGKSDLFRQIVKTDAGIFRGISFGTPWKEVASKEDSVSADVYSNDTLDYVIDVSELESFEVVYYFDRKSKVEKIEVEIYPSNKQSQAELFNEFLDYFNKKYKVKPVETPNAVTWEVHNEGLRINMKKTGNERFPDILFEFSRIPLTKGISS